MNTTLLKWLKWEFWPYWFFYLPLSPKYFWLSAKAGSLAFFTAANPLMKHGGLKGYSKYKVLEKINPIYLPYTYCFPLANYDLVLKHLEESRLNFPIILKPDIGERGAGVERINSVEDLEQYFTTENNISNLILQEYIPYSLELGIMYSRKPAETQGKITSIVIKDFLSVVGDGRKTLLQLIESDDRARFYLEDLKVRYADQLSQIPASKERIELMSIGNHCRGTKFMNGNHLISNDLESVFDRISVPIEGFYFGRFDLRVSSLDDLLLGKNIKILELNGAASEPAHIYDPATRLLDAYKHLYGHWQRLYEISRTNHQNGIAYDKVRDVYKTVFKEGK